MSALDRRVLKLYEAETSGALIRFRRAAAPNEKWYGYVVGVGAAFVLLHIVGSDGVYLNGYTALPLTEIRKIELLSETEFLHRALQMKRIAPKPQPDILLLDFPGLLSSANTVFPLVTIHPENKWPGTCHIGRVEQVTKKTVTLYEIDPQAHWDWSETYRFKDITRVDFGDGYADALWLLSEPAGRVSTRKTQND
jgi:hypothetical protein